MNLARTASIVGWFCALGLFGCSGGAPESESSSLASDQEALRAGSCEGPRHSSCGKGAAAAGAALSHRGACAPKAPFCGGIAGIACPGLGKCLDDPTDSCDPKAGGADCGGICSCVDNALCVQGAHFNGDPQVCQCVPDAPACVQNVLCVRGSHFDSDPSVCRCVPDAAP